MAGGWCTPQVATRAHAWCAPAASPHASAAAAAAGPAGHRDGLDRHRVGRGLHGGTRDRRRAARHGRRPQVGLPHPLLRLRGGAAAAAAVRAVLHAAPLGRHRRRGAPAALFRHVRLGRARAAFGHPLGHPRRHARPHPLLPALGGPVPPLCLVGLPLLHVLLYRLRRLLHTSRMGRRPLPRLLPRLQDKCAAPSHHLRAPAGRARVPLS